MCFSCLSIRLHSFDFAVVHHDLLHGSVQQEGTSVLCTQSETHTAGLNYESWAWSIKSVSLTVKIKILSTSSLQLIWLSDTVQRKNSGCNLRCDSVTWRIPEAAPPARTRGRCTDWLCVGSESLSTAWAAWWFPNTAGPGSYKITRRQEMRLRELGFKALIIILPGLCMFLWPTCHCCVMLWHDLWTPSHPVQGRNGRKDLVWWFCWDLCPGRSEGSSH